jgi:hypothetical protein
MWKDIPGWDRYQVSDEGRVRSKDMSCRAVHGSLAVRKGRELTLVAKSGRYLCVTLTTTTGERKQCFVHDLVLLTFVGPKPAGLQTRHLNDNNRDNLLSNLAYGTHLDNMADKARNGRIKGEGHHKSKLTDNQVRYIRASPAPGVVLAKALGVSPSLVSAIRHRKVWGHLII